MAKATKKTEAPTPPAGKKGAAAKSRKPPSKAEIASARNKDASGQDPSDGFSLNTPGLAASPEVLNRLWTIIDSRKGVDAAVSHSARLLANRETLSRRLSATECRRSARRRWSAPTGRASLLPTSFCRCRTGRQLSRSGLA